MSTVEIHINPNVCVCVGGGEIHTIRIYFR